MEQDMEQAFMCGGDPDVFKNELQEMLESIATTNGCLYTGKNWKAATI